MKSARRSRPVNSLIGTLKETAWGARPTLPVQEVFVTEQDALNAGRFAVEQRGWRFHEPARVVVYRRGLAGREVMVVLTRPNKKGETARVELDARTGEVLDADFRVR